MSRAARPDGGRGPGPARTAAGTRTTPGPTPRGAAAGGGTLRVNPIACEAHGTCVELLPELISADPWGYPIIAPGHVPDDLLPLARRAVATCPTLALLLDRDE
jgi:ferredoxin